MNQKRLYQAILVIGFLPTIAMFIWGVHQALQTKSELIVPWFSQMQ